MDHKVRLMPITVPESARKKDIQEIDLVVWELFVEARVPVFPSLLLPVFDQETDYRYQLVVITSNHSLLVSMVSPIFLVRQ
jgi:hypothetical protein